jgi:NADH:ubiquinone oxidoreductase subunit 5 (subunit L)/multisubunit Na+/H+ antiporter MnhA subunit
LAYSLLLIFLLPIIGIPFTYFGAKKSSKIAGFTVALIALINMGLLFTTLPTLMTGVSYTEPYNWIPVLNSQFLLFVDGISFTIAFIALILILASALFSINYMEGKKNLPTYYVLLSLLSVGLVGVFITSNLL